jgi:diphosphomevalonate decarboxylase
LWESEEAALTESVLPPLTDLVLVLTEAAKKVSSSEAHARVKTSPLWQGRKERAEARCQTVLRALKCGDFKTLSEHSWSELWEMHSLFHTSIEPFSYFTGESVEALRFATLFLKDKNPPIVTLDAGANLHWIVPDTEADVWTRRLLEQFPGKRILTDHQGTGGFPFEA